jgi:PTS system galactitol-specific IIA component
MAFFRRDLCWAGLQAQDAAEVMRTLSRALLARGLVRPTFEAAVLAREAESPTGLPLSGRKVALPHADPEHVIAPAVALCTLGRPLPFREMGNPESELQVELVAMLALPDHESAQTELVRLIESFQETDHLDRLCTAPDADSLYALLTSDNETGSATEG